MPGTVLDIENSAVNKTHKIPAGMSLDSALGPRAKETTALGA